MLRIVVSATELFNESTQLFTDGEEFVLELEHSLVSVSKWESKFERPFLANNKKTAEDILEYVRCMIISPNYPENIMARLSPENLEEIQKYIDSKQSATYFSELRSPSKGKTEVITSELIYYWLAAFRIPFEVETWHLNRLFALIRIHNIKQSKPKKMSRTELAQYRSSLNAQRRQELNTRG
jgi:hypothetical protein